MTSTKLIMALALLFSTTSLGAAQSQRNYGPDGPSAYGCYGSVYTGTAASRCPGTPEGGPWRQQSQRRQPPPDWPRPAPGPQWQGWR